MGLYRRKDRKVPWWGWWRDREGKKKAAALGMTKEQASRALAVIRARELDRKHGIQHEHEAPTLKEFGATYLERHAQPRKRDWQHDEQRLRKHLVPMLGDMPVDEIGGGEVSHLVASLRKKGLSPATCNRVLALLRKILRCARDWGEVETEPVRIEKLRERDDGFRYVEGAADVGRLLEEIGEPRLRAVVAFLAYTGARKGEALGLDWRDVDLTAGLVTIHRSGDGATKSGKSRTVPIHPDLRQVLMDHRMRSGRPDAGPVFVAWGGKRYRDLRSASKALAAACEWIRIPRVTLHSLRHTFAAHFVMAGGDLATLRVLLGHSSLVVTQRYVHLAPEHVAAQVAQVQFGGFQNATRSATKASGSDPRKSG